MQKAIARPDPEAFLQYVRDTLEEPNKLWKAGQRLIKLRQRSDQAVSEYIPLFEGALFRAGGEKWDDRAQTLLLLTGLNATTRQRLDREAWPDQWDVLWAYRPLGKRLPCGKRQGSQGQYCLDKGATLRSCTSTLGSLGSSGGVGRR
jgi:hypothetical protein